MRQFLTCFLLLLPLLSRAQSEDIQEYFCIENAVTHEYIQTVEYPDDDYSFTRITDYTTQPTTYRKDYPQPARLNATGSRNAAALLAEIYREGLLVRSDTFEVDQTVLEIWNLIPQLHYTYTLYFLRENGTRRKIGQGAFKTTGQVRMLQIDGVKNCRDIGGWRLPDGRQIKYGMLFRSGELATENHQITPQGIHELLDVLGVEVEIDFGSIDGSPVADRLEHVRGSDYQIVDYANGLKTTGLQYKNCFEKTVNSLREGKKVLFHCDAGADRTGTFAFLLEGLLGVSESDLAKDYELTSFVYDERYRNYESRYKQTIEYVKTSFPGRTINEKIEQMALSLGISQEDIDDFRSLMTEEAPVPEKGDANGDYFVNAADLVETVNYIMGSPSKGYDFNAADVNRDGRVNATDIVFITKMIMGDYISTEKVSKSGLWVMEIMTENGEEPKCEKADAPEGCIGSTVINATKVPCQIIITHNNDTLYHSGKYQKNKSGATIKINGNQTAFNAKEGNWPLKIKLQKEADLLCRGSEKYADTEWRLLNDALSLNTILGLKVSQILNMEWTPGCVPCNVMINGDYRGCYLLIECVKRNKDCRINVDKQTGAIVERDPYWWSEDRYFSTSHLAKNNRYQWTWKYPDEDDVTTNLEMYLKNYIEQAESSIKDGTYEEYIDTESFARWILTHDILGTQDSGGSNLYVAKYDSTDASRLRMPLLWDYDSNFGVDLESFSLCHYSDSYYFPYLFNSKNKAFLNCYKKIWNEVKPTLHSQIENAIMDFLKSEELVALNKSRDLQYKRWRIFTRTPTEKAVKALIWFRDHLPLLDKEIEKLE